MAFSVKFTFDDAYGRTTSRTWHNTEATIAAVLADVTEIAPTIEAISDGGLTDVTITVKSTDETFDETAGANVDANASVTVEGSDGYKYDFNIPMPKAAKLLTDGSVNTADGDVTDFFDQFSAPNTWRINLRNPTQIAAVIGGKLDE